jgi:chromosome segregation ATPase
MRAYRTLSIQFNLTPAQWYFMSLSNTLEKLIHTLRKNAMLPDDVEDVFQRLITELGELEAMVSELTSKLEDFEEREITRDEQMSELEERVSELEANVPNLDES